MIFEKGVIEIAQASGHRMYMYVQLAYCYLSNIAESISLLDEKGKAIVKIPDMLSMEEATGYFTNRGSYILLKCESELFMLTGEIL